MKCPLCSYESGKTLHTCPHCGEAFDRAGLETLGHLIFLEAWLTQNAPDIGFGRTDSLLVGVRARMAAVHKGLLPQEAPPAARGAIPTWPAWAPSPTPVPPVIAPPPAAPAVVTAPPPTRAAEAAVPAPVAPLVTVVPPPLPDAVEPAPEAPKAPALDWGKVWARSVDLAVSGALLRGLLFLGAFMIVVSAAVLVWLYWPLFPMALQLAIAAAVPLVFYCAGWLLRSRLTLPVAGSVFVGIGALLVAVDCVAIYQLGGLATVVEIRAYWLIASVLCTAVYALTAWRLPEEAFGYIALTGLGSTVLAATQWLRLPWEWGFAAVTALGAALVEVAARARAGARWAELVTACRRMPLPLLPAMQVAALLAPGDAAWGQAATFGLAAAGYGLRAWRAPHPVFAHAAVWSSVLAAVLAALGTGLRLEWYPAAAAAISPAYILAAWRIGRQDQAAFAYGRAYATAAYLAGFGLVAASLAGAPAVLYLNWWAGVSALFIACLIFAWCARLMSHDLFVLPAVGLFALTFSLAAARLLADSGIAGWPAWLVAAWSGLALLYLGAAGALRASPAVARWLHLGAHVLAPAAVVGLFAVLFWRPGSGDWPRAATLAGLTGVLLVYVASAVMHHSGSHPALSKYTALLGPPVQGAVFLWAVAALGPFWLASLWSVLTAPAAWLGLALTGLALVYLAAGETLARRRAEYRLPFSAVAFLLPAAGAALGQASNWALLAVLVTAAAVYTGLTFFYRRQLMSSLAVLSVALALAQFLRTVGVAPALHASAWIALAYAYLVLERYLARAQAGTWLATFRLPLGVGALATWGLGLLLTVEGTVVGLRGAAGVDYAPLILAQTLATGLTMLAAWLYRSRLPLFVEPLVGFFTVTLFFAGYGAQILGRPLHGVEYALVWLGFGLAQSLAAVALDRLPVRYAHGLHLGGYGLATLALLWSLPDRVVTLLVLGACIVFALLSQVLVHLGRHASFDDLIQLIWRQPGTAVRRAAQTVFLYIAACAFPVWLVLLLTHGGVGLAWQGLALALTAPIYLALGLLSRRLKAEYAWPLYSAAYALTAIGAMVSFDNELVAIAVLVLDAAVYAVSAYIFRQPFWLYLSNSLVPVIVLVSLHYRGQLTGDWVAATFMALAFIYVAAGQAFDRLAKEHPAGRPNVAPYALPFYAPGYLLSALALASAAAGGDRISIIYTFCAGVALYAISARLFREPLFLYLAAWLAAVPYHFAMTLTALPPEWYGVAWLPFIVAGIALAKLVFRQEPATQPDGDGSTLTRFLSHPGLPIYALAYGLSACMVGLSLPVTLPLAVATGLAAALYMASAVLFRQRLFLYLGVWVAAASYHVAMTLTTVPPSWYGVAWLPFIVAGIALARLVFHHGPAGQATGLRGAFGAALGHRGLPIYGLAYGLSVYMVAASRFIALPLAVASGLAAVLYLGSAVLFRRAGWLYPALLAAHLWLAALLTLFPSDQPPHTMALPFMGLTWLFALIGYGLSRRFAPTVARAPLPQRLAAASWGQPFLLVAAVDVVFWQAIALSGSLTAIALGVGFALLLGLFTFLWSEGMLAYGAVALSQIAALYALREAGLAWPQVFACLGAIGLLLYFLGRLAERAAGRQLPRLVVWVTPLTHSAVFLTGMAVLAALPTTQAQPTPTAAALTFAGALYLAAAYRGRYHQLGYLGAALLEVAWALVLFFRSVGQPQYYAIPAGLYFVAVGYLERRRAKRAYASLIESLGLAVLLLTAFAQSLNGAEGFPYFLLLLVEGLLVIWWGAARRIRIPFAAGLGASVLNVVTQVAVLVNVYRVDSAVIIFCTGLVLVTLAVFVERQQARLVARAREWREILETWE